MVKTTYGGLVEQGGNITVTGTGIAAGPSGGDGWQIVAILPAEELPSGSSRFALFVHGKIHNIQRLVQTQGPVRGVLQLCLGFDTGGRSPIHCVNLPLRTQSGVLEGIPFGFNVVQFSAPAVSDPYFGATFNPSAGSQWCLWARIYTNGDPLTYSYSFDVGDLSWLWFDTGRIPAADALVEHYVPTTPLALTTTAQLAYANLNSPGLAGEKWLHFHGVDYSPPNGTLGQLQAPIFQFGYTTDGTLTGWNTMLARQGRWAQSHGDSQIVSLGASAAPRLAQFGWWFGDQPSGTFLPGFRAQERHTLGGTAATKIHRYTYFGVKLDNLPDVLTRAETSVASATGNRYSATPAEGAAYVPLERPATGAIRSPVVLSSGLIPTTGRQDYEAEIYTNRRPLRISITHCIARAALAEGCQCMAFSKRGFAASLPDVQYRARFTGGLNAPPLSLSVTDFYIVQFGMIRDPDGDPKMPNTPGNPVEITVGREAAASQPDLPIQPDGDVAEDWEEPRIERIEGSTGYKRSWPVFLVPRRRFTLSWSALDEADTTTLIDFLTSNETFAWTPPRESTPIVCKVIDDATAMQISGQVYAVSLTVVELIWTGP